MPETRYFTCNLCEAMCGLSLSVEAGRIVELRGDTEDVFSRGYLCPKAYGLRELREDPDRLRTPLRRTGSGWEAISWDEALAEAAAGLAKVRQQHGRDAIGWYLGNPAAHTHRASLGALALEGALRSRNRFDANSQDANPRTFACQQMYGDAVAVPVPDVDRTDFFLVLGGNPAISGGSLMSLGDVRGRLRELRARGGRIVVIDPRRNETAAMADRHHFLRPGGDAALLFAMLQVLFVERLVDEAKVQEVAGGLNELRALALQFPPERVEAATGLPAETIRSLSRQLASAKSAVVYGRIGTCQNLFGPLANWLIEALNVVTGNFDKPGGAMFCTPAADLGPLARLFLPSGAGRFHSRVRGLPEFLGALPSAVMAEEMETAGEGQIRAFLCVAGNPVSSTPNGERLARALGGLEFMVSIDIYLNETSRLANLILPPSQALETGNYDLLLAGFAVRNIAKWSPPALPRTEGARDDWQIASELALRLSLPASAPHAWLARKLRDLPDTVVDTLLKLGPYKLSLDKLREKPHGMDLGALKPSRKARVRTPDRRVRLSPAPLTADVPRLARWVDERRAAALASPGAPASLELIGRRSLRSNNSWMHNAPSLAKGPDRARLLINPADAARLALSNGAEVRVRSRVGSVSVRLTVTDEVMQGVVSLPHGFGHAAAKETLRVAGALPGVSANALTDELMVEPLLGTSILNGVPVTVEAI